VTDLHGKVSRLRNIAPPTMAEYQSRVGMPRVSKADNFTDRDRIEKLVSVVTVCFNSADTLERTIDSIARQTYRPIEYIVVDGGSTDGTLEVLQRRSADIAAWISERDLGIATLSIRGSR